MRIHKYRLWHKKEKSWISSDGTYPSWLITPDGSVLWDWHEGYEYYAKNEIELVQFTGLKDKQGVEIYEGDIVEFKDITFDFLDEDEKDLKFSGRTEVEFRSGSFGLKQVRGGKYMGYGLSPGFDSIVPFTRSFEEKIEVVGNIFENEELLEDKK